MKGYIRIVSFMLVAVFAVSCTAEQPVEGTSDGADIPVLLSLDTKSGSPGEDATFRAALFRLTDQALLAQGTYCSKLLDYSGTSGYQWLSPCKVNSNGEALTEGDEVTDDLSNADRRSQYGLRYSAGGNYYIVLSSPAKAYEQDVSGRYHTWDPNSSLYISDPVVASLSGSWLDNEYVYSSSTKISPTMLDRRARLKIHIECGALETANIQTVSLNNCVTGGRWYLVDGFSASNYTVANQALFNYVTDNAGVILPLVKNTTSWTSTAIVYLPAIDYSLSAYEDLRPSIEVEMGDSPSNPVTATIPILEQMFPQKIYTYNLYVSKSYVSVSLSVSEWDNGGTSNSADQSFGHIGNFSITGWDDNGTLDTTDWNTF